MSCAKFDAIIIFNLANMHSRKYGTLQLPHPVNGFNQNIIYTDCNGCAMRILMIMKILLNVAHTSTWIYITKRIGRVFASFL